jgi:hypothetical protein
METAEMFDHIQSRPNEQVIGVPENDLRVQFAQLARSHRFDRALCSDRHEDGRFDDTVRGRQAAAPRFCMSILREKFEHCSRLRAIAAQNKFSRKNSFADIDFSPIVPLPASGTRESVTSSRGSGRIFCRLDFIGLGRRFVWKNAHD